MYKRQPFTVDGKNGIKLLTKVNKTLQDRPEVCKYLADQLENSQLCNLFVYCPTNGVRVAACAVMKTLISVVGLKPLKTLAVSSKDLHVHPEKAAPIMDAYIFASKIDSCSQYLKETVLPFLQKVVLKFVDDKLARAYPMDSLFEAIEVLGPTNDFISEFCRSKAMEKFFLKTNLDKIAAVIKHGDDNCFNLLTESASKYQNPKWKALLEKVRD